MACSNNDLNELTYLLYAGFPILQDKDGKWPNEVSSDKDTIKKANTLFGLCVGKEKYDKVHKRIAKTFSRTDFLRNLVNWMNITKGDYEYCVTFKYLEYNRTHRIWRSSRFSITSMFSNKKSFLTAEREIRMLIDDKVNVEINDALVEDSYATLTEIRYFN